MGQRIAVLNDGTLQQVGPPQEVYDRPANRFVAEFIGSPAMNFLEGGVVRENDRDGIRTPEGFLALPDAVSAEIRQQGVRSFVVGIRPEHLTPVAEQAAAAFEGTADLVESLGSEQHVTVALKETAIVVRLPSSPRIERGSTLRLAVAPEHLHLFDAETQLRVGP